MVDIEKSAENEGKPVRVFISYAHQDADIVSRLEKHLAVLSRQGKVSTWFDRRIEAGKEWRKEIEANLESSQIILLVISADFLASDYCYGVEVQRALQRHDSGNAVVIPVIARPVDWHLAPFAKLQALPRDGRPVVSWRSQDEALATISTDLQSVIRTFQVKEAVPDPHSTAEIELVINRDFDSFTDLDQKRLLDAIRSLLETTSDVRIARKERGSVKLRLHLRAEEVLLLQKAVQDGELRDLNVVDAEVLVDELASDPTQRPRVFIGSSSEGLPIAEAIQVNLDDLCEVTLWSQGVFGLGQGTLEALVNRLDDFDFAILILTPDDLVESRGDRRDSPRDNVLLELGLFIGRLGRERTFTVYDRTADLKLPSDLAGVTLAPFQPHSSGNFQAALGAPCTKLKNAIRGIGGRRLRADDRSGAYP